jgi:isopentenyl-diphosphate delta-isomerase
MSTVAEQMLVLVDEKNNPLGLMGKMEVHEKALLHRAFSVFIFNRKGDMLLQRRAIKKYHSGGLWTNACCSHPLWEETPVQAAQRRMQEELGFVTELEHAFDFIYKAKLDNNLTEHEYDHVLIGAYDGKIQPNEDEVGDYCFISMRDLKASVEQYPLKYTEWFKIALPLLEQHFSEKKYLFHVAN